VKTNPRCSVALPLFSLKVEAFPVAHFSSSFPNFPTHLPLAHIGNHE
jgi:hypothetical protein